MTTPERLRRRQRFESVGIAVLAVALVAAFLYFQGQADAQKRCLTSFVSNSSQTSAIRAGLAERDSQTQRRFLLDATDPAKVQTRAQFERVRAQFVKRLAAIDRARAENPVKPLPKGVCD